jgi:tetratricopeptide (TPR) repeat protein
MSDDRKDRRGGIGSTGWADVGSGTPDFRLLDRRFLCLLFLFALLVRGAYAWRIRDLPTQHALVMDARHYDDLARDIVAHGWMPREVFFQAPLYPYVLAAVYAPTGGSRGAVRCLQLAADATAVVLLAVVAARLFGAAAGRVAGALAALYGFLVFSAPLLLKTTFTVLAEVVLLVLLIPPPGRAAPGRGRALLAGACLGLAALLQENLLLLAPCVVLFLLLQGGPGRLVSIVTFGAGALLAVAPVTLINYRTGGELVLTSSQGGMNFYFGNSRGASGTFPDLGGGSQDPEMLKQESRRLAAAIETRRTGRPVSVAELTPRRVSAVFWHEALRQIGEAPLDWARLMAWKTRLFWNADEIPDAEGYRVYRRLAGAVAWPWLGFGLVAPLGLAGLVLAWRRAGGGSILLLALLIAGLCVSVVLFFVFGRYRLPVVPFLIPPAGFAVVAVADLIHQRARRELALVAAGLAVLFLAVGWPAYMNAELAGQDAAIWFNISSAALRWAEEENAEFQRGAGVAHLERAVELTGEADDDLERAVAANPGFFIARVQRAVALHRHGVYLASGGALEPAVAAYGEARQELAALRSALAASGRDLPDLPDIAEQARGILAAVDANSVRALTNLGARRLESGNPGGAAAALRQAIALDPAAAGAYGNLGLCLLAQGDREGSRAAFRRALALAGPTARSEEIAFYRRGLARVAEP